MKAITVKQPWAWAIAHGGKTIENRTWLAATRGLICIHAGKADDEDGGSSPLVRAAWRAAAPEHRVLVRGAIIAVAELVDAHQESHGCCQPWGMAGACHLVLRKVRPVKPLPYRGALGLWAVPDAIVDALLAELPS